MLSITSLYNMALCCQINGEQNIKDRLQYKNKAKKLYMHAVRMVEKIDEFRLQDDVSLNDITSLSLLSATIACNIACLYAETFDYDNVELFLDWAETKISKEDVHQIGWYIQAALSWRQWRSFASPVA